MAMNFPDCIYALGGAGKELIFNTLKQEWILKEILKPQRQPNKCVIMIIDTCVEDKSKDWEIIENIKNSIRTITEEYIKSNPTSGMSSREIEISYHLLTLELRLERPVDLGGEGVKASVLNATDAKCWWINDDQISTDWYKKVKSKENLQNLNFTKGVYRKRAIAKAVYYKAIAENKFDVEFPGRNIDIICGLGGGTGSGIVLSLAKKIKEKRQGSDIHLFGVISTLNESEDEKANCAAILSELEYMKIFDSRLELNEDDIGNMDASDNNIFKSIVLLPIEPTEYAGELNLDIKRRSQILEYDDVFPYVLIAFHNTQGTQPEFLDSQGFAPFCVAIPHLVRYNVNYIKNIQDSIEENMKEKQKSQNYEDSIYDLAKEYLKNYFEDVIENNPKGNILDDDDTVFIDERYKQFKTALNSKYFEELQYKKLLKLKKIVNKIDEKKSSESYTNNMHIDEIIKIINDEIIGEGFNAFNASTVNDDFASKIMVEDLRNIDSLILILKQINDLKQINGLDNNLIKKVLKSCVKPQNEESLGSRVSITNEAIEEEERRYGFLNKKLKDLIDECDTFKGEIENAAKKRDQKWKRDVENTFIDYKQFQKDVPDIKRSFEALKTAMENFVEEINKSDKESVINKIDTSNLEKKFFDFFKCGVPALDCHQIISIMKGIKVSEIKSKKKLGWPEKWIPGKTNGKIEKIEAAKRRDIFLANLTRLLSDLSNDEGIKLGLKFSDSVFSYAFLFSMDDYISEKSNAYEELILKDLRREYTNNTASLFEDLKKKLRVSETLQIINIEEIVKCHEDYDEKVAVFEVSISKTQADVENSSYRIKKYTSLKDKLSKSAPLHKDYLSSLSSYNSYFLEADKNYENRKSLLGKDIFVTEIQPQQIFEIMSLSSNINKVIQNEQERQLLIREVKNSFFKLSSKRYNTLAVKSFSDEAQVYSWDKTTLGCAMITKATQIEFEVVEGIGTNLKSEFCLADNSRNFNNWTVPCGDDWGVGIVLFITPIPLDNINNFVDVTKGYFQSYQKIKKDPNKLFVLHNCLLLEKGKFIERSKINDLEYSEEVKKQFLVDEKETKKFIAQNLKVKKLSDVVDTI